MSGERMTDFEALDGLSPVDAAEMRDRIAWRDPWPGHVRPCAAELDAVDALRATGRPVYPARGRETAALYTLPFEDVRVVILGIDPYPDEEAATGLAFSLPAGMAIGRRTAVRVMRETVLREYPIDGAGRRTTGDLSAWAHQGVLLLNRALTFSPDQGTYGHKAIWEPYTNAIIRALDRRNEPPVFLLMGNPAKRARRLIEHAPVVETIHPSAPGRSREFIDERPFHKVSALLCDGPASIDWTL